MKMKQGKNKTPIFVFLILIATMLFAILPNSVALTDSSSLTNNNLQEDFTITNEKSSLSLCNCNIAQTSAIITNIGDVTSTYKVLITENSVSDWVSVSNDYFSLKPGESKKIDIFMNVPCNAKGDYKAEFKIITLFDSEKTFSQDFSVNQCLNALVYSTDLSKSTCPCQPKTFNFKLKNTGEIVESYHISVKDTDIFKDYSSYFAVSEDLIILGPNQEKEFYVTANFPCWMYGDKDLILVVEGEKSKMETDVPFNLDILPCYEYNLTSDGYFEVCNDVQDQKIEFEIQNIADVSNNYGVSVSGVSFLTPSEKDVYAFKNESVESELIVDISSKTQPGEYQATITTISEKGGVVKETPITIKVNDCYNAEVSMESYLSAVNCESNTYSFEVTNTGTKGATFNLGLTAPDFMSLEKDSIYVSAGATGYGKIDAEIPCEAEHKAYRIYVSAEQENIGTITKKPILEITSIEEAYMPSIDFNSNELENLYEKEEIEVIITNDGIRKATYELSTEGAEWIKLDKTLITLEPGESATANLIVNPTLAIEEGTYWFDIKAKLSGTDIVYSKTDKVALRLVPLSEKLKNIAIMYVLPYGAILIALIVLGFFLFWLIRKIKRKISEKRKENAEKAKKELERKRKQKVKPLIAKEELKKEQKKAKRGFWGPFLAILLILLLLGGIGLIAFNFDKIKENTTNAWNSLTNSTEIDDTIINKVQVYIDRTNLEGTGNNILISDQGVLEIPIIVSNPTDYKVIFSIQLDKEATWISADKEVILLESNQTETLNLYVNTTTIYGNDYEINVQSRILEDDGTRVEKVQFNIVSKPDYKTYSAYALGGLLALFIVLILIWSISNVISGIRNKKDKSKYKKVSKKGVKKLKTEETFEQVYKRKRAFKITSIILVVLILIAGVVFLGFFLADNLQSESTLFNETNEKSEDVEELDETIVVEEQSELDITQETTEEIEEIIEEETEEIITEPITESDSLIFIDRGDLEGTGNSIEVYGKETVLIPTTIKNPTNESMIYYLGLPEDVNWATLSAEYIIVAGNSQKTIELEVVPSLMQEGEYELNLMIQLQGEETVKVEKLNITLSNENKFGWVYYIYYAVAGLIFLGLVLFGITKLMNRKKSEKKK